MAEKVTAESSALWGIEKMSKKKSKNKNSIRKGVTEIDDICMFGIELWDHITPEEFGFVQKTKEERAEFWYTTIFEDTEDLEEKEIGFSNECDYLDSHNEQDKVVLAKKDNFYIVYGAGEVVKDNGFDTDITQIVTNNYEEAKKYFDSIEPETENPKDKIREVREKLGELSESIWIDMKDNCFSVYYNIKYRNRLLIEKAPDLDAEMIRQQAERYDNLDEELRKKGITISELYKAPREWNDNQRYYLFSFTTRSGEFDELAHIPSKMQHKMRLVLDYYKPSWLKEIAEEAAEELSEEEQQEPYTCPLCGTGHPDGCGCKKIIFCGTKVQDRIPVEKEDTGADGRCRVCGAKIGQMHHIGCVAEHIPGRNIPMSKFWMIEQDDDGEITYVADNGKKWDYMLSIEGSFLYPCEEIEP